MPVILAAIMMLFLAGCEDSQIGPFREYCRAHGGTYIVQPPSNPDGDVCVDQLN